jgi:hypothetical protein
MTYTAEMRGLKKSQLCVYTTNIIHINPLKTKQICFIYEELVHTAQ